MFARLGGHDRGRIHGRLDVVGLRERGGDRYRNSLGMKQRLGAGGKTVFVSSHLLAEIQAACDSIVMIDHGGVMGPGRSATSSRRVAPVRLA